MLKKSLLMLSLFLTVALLAGCGSAYGPSPVVEATGPVVDDGPMTAEKILALGLEKSGGAKAMEKHHGMKMTGTFSLPAMGVTAPIEVYQKAPNLMYTRIQSDMFGTIESGSNGSVHWEKSMMSGSKIKTGEEAAVAERQATFNLALKWKEFYDKAELAGEEEVDGTPCYKVIMTPKVGEPETTWIAKDSFLTIKSETTLNSEMGAISIEMNFSDFREMDGVLVPFKTRQVLMGMQEMLITADSMQWDPEFPAGVFELPDDIKALQ